MRARTDDVELRAQLGETFLVLVLFEAKHSDLRRSSG